MQISIWYLTIFWIRINMLLSYHFIFSYILRLPFQFFAVFFYWFRTLYLYFYLSLFKYFYLFVCLSLTHFISLFYSPSHYRSPFCLFLFFYMSFSDVIVDARWESSSLRNASLSLWSLWKTYRKIEIYRKESGRGRENKRERWSVWERDIQTDRNT